MVVVSVAVGEGGKDELFLGVGAIVEEGICDLAFVEEGLEAAERASLLGEGLAGDASLCGMDCRVDSIQEIVVAGSVTILKEGGTCDGFA